MAALADTVVQAARAAIPERLLAALAQGSVRKGAAGQGAARISTQRGRPLAPRPGLPRNGARLSVLATLRAAAPWQKLRGPPPARARRRVSTQDLRIKRVAERIETTVLFVVDASGMAGLPGGGATPLAAGLDAGLVLALAERAKGRSVLVLVMSDGRANVARDGGKDRARAMSDARAAAQRYRFSAIPSVFIDTGRWPSADTEALAKDMGARYAPLPFASAQAVRGLVQP